MYYNKVRYNRATVRRSIEARAMRHHSGYAWVLIPVQYIDTDSAPVVITITKDHENKLLELDFLKVDFSKQPKYTKPMG